MELFKLREGAEFIELNKLIKGLNWVGSGGEAKVVIQEGEVTVNGEVETRVRKKLRAGDTVRFNDEEGKVE